jgi:hypothetical protein
MVRRYKIGPKRNLLPFTIEGTTMSGDAAATTLGNTFRELLYVNFYIYLKTKVYFWNDNRYFTPTAGDDSVIMV